MQIRRLVPADAAEYRSLRIRALWEYPEAFTCSYEEDERKPVESTHTRLASQDTLFWGAFDSSGQLCGMVGMDRETRAKNRHKAHVVGMYVTPEQSGAGVGRALIEALLEEARRAGIELLVLTVTGSNEAARSLYESTGFRSFGVEPKAIRIDGRYHAKNHMYQELNTAP